MATPRPTQQLERIPLDTFIADYWTPMPGEHTALIGPNGHGKTTVGLRLLAKAHELHPHVRGVALAMKPDKGPKSEGRKATGDRTVARLTRALGGRIARRWPPPLLWPWQHEPAFWAYWPRHTMDPHQDLPAHQEAFAACLLESYKKGDRWVFMDEAYSLSNELKLDTEMVTLWTKGRSMNVGVFAATQRPAHVPLWFYSESKHFFLWAMTDGAAYDRLKEIGNVDPQLIRSALSTLGKHECLYLYAPERRMAILTS